MSDESKDLGSFMSKESRTLAGQQSMNEASSDNPKSEPIGVPGRYLCEVATFAYDKNHDKMVFPKVFVSQSKGSLNMSLSLRVVDGTPLVQKGSSIFTNIVLCPKSDKKEDIDKTMRFAKPKLAALTGTEKISFTNEWMHEHLVACFDKKDGKYVLTKDHKMKQQVMAVVDFEQNSQTGKVQLTVKSFSKAKPGDKSESIPVVAPEGSELPPPSDDSGSPINYTNAVDNGDVDVGAEEVPTIPDTQDF